VERTAEEKSGSIQSVERAGALLDVFFEDGQQLSVSEVAARTHLAPATVHRLLTTLVKMDWLEQDTRNSRYELSERLLGSAALALASSSLLRHGQQFLHQVSDATNLNTFLAVPRDRVSVLLARVQGKLGSASDFQVGRTLPLHASASGKVFLAYMPEKKRRQVLEELGELRQFTPNTITDKNRLEAELITVRELGYGAEVTELRESHRSLAVPVRRRDGSVVAALCCGGWKPPGADQDWEESILRELLPATEEFSRVYGQFAPW
jgi:DNA-binding IclR family transcriptional regulator